MALTGSELRHARRRLGSLPSDSDLQAIYDAYLADGEAHPLEWAILDVLETRLAELIRNPATFSVAGEYSQSTAANIEAMRAAVTAQRGLMASMGIVLDVAYGVGFGILHAEGPQLHR